MHFLVVENAHHAVEFLRSHGSAIDTENDFGNTPLVDAATLGYLEMCRYLVDRGANVRHVSAESGDSAFSRAASAERIDVLSYLLGLLSPDEDLNFLFSDVDAEVILDYHACSAELLVSRGLRRRWMNEENAS